MSDKPKKRAGKSASFSAEEVAAMQDAKAERKKGKKANDEADLLAKIAEMDGNDKALAEGLHALVKAHAPQLTPKTWYGMPAYADESGKAMCFFTAAGKFKERYATLGFNTNARLDDGDMWPTSFALLKLGAEEEKRIVALLKKAVG
jgi:uncharacterized protein YdhG (YjbR/CyaY superfamily)